jgi:hypothetical protein
MRTDGMIDFLVNGIDYYKKIEGLARHAKSTSHIINRITLMPLQEYFYSNVCLGA